VRFSVRQSWSYNATGSSLSASASSCGSGCCCSRTEALTWLLQVCDFAAQCTLDQAPDRKDGAPERLMCLLLRRVSQPVGESTHSWVLGSSLGSSRPCPRPSTATHTPRERTWGSSRLGNQDPNQQPPVARQSSLRSRGPGVSSS
jgi:hypothetical protein